ncbi:MULTISPECIES: TOPRIM nucleotidyl transferase/hydrolase domain-containing protein [unclassified Sinorhizobium]|uniref:TOPRIM nucleotidyl transferase/hydrolase domain-containing protein n=1 Tax=unclassified Sinorhizobium TaxID=2613772 RepID=UPI00352598F4
MTGGEISDLERYLDSTKGSLLYAWKVMPVDGAVELFLIPALIESVHKIKLERVGISLTAIHRVHFDIYAKLFARGSLEKRCAITPMLTSYRQTPMHLILIRTNPLQT